MHPRHFAVDVLDIASPQSLAAGHEIQSENVKAIEVTAVMTATGQRQESPKIRLSILAWPPCLPQESRPKL